MKIPYPYELLREIISFFIYIFISIVKAFSQKLRLCAKSQIRFEPANNPVLQAIPAGVSKEQVLCKATN